MLGLDHIRASNKKGVPSTVYGSHYLLDRVPLGLVGLNWEWMLSKTGHKFLFISLKKVAEIIGNSFLELF